ncbi:hypothetical protein, partial [Massilia scottii]|uniref:hypothetical protein n=1 Tax=Massilia scottii TaxID=3057166 RepID=UPI0027967440
RDPVAPSPCQAEGLSLATALRINKIFLVRLPVSGQHHMNVSAPRRIRPPIDTDVLKRMLTVLSVSTLVCKARQISANDSFRQLGKERSLLNCPEKVARNALC